MSRCFSDRIDWPARNAIRGTGRHTATVVRANTIVLPHSTGSRRGTAVKLVRIRPVAYSPATSSTPRTPTAIAASWTPVRLTAVGSKAAGSAGGRATRSRQYRTPKPTIETTVTSSDQAVEGSERSLVHSEWTTRAWLSRWAAGLGGRTRVTGRAAVMAGLPSGRGRGTRPRPG